MSNALQLVALQLAQATTAEQAEAWLARLSDPFTRAELRREWLALVDQQVQHVGSPKCRCSHIQDHHYIDRRGKTVCRSAACGCAEYRPGGTK